ncbi:MAG: hypothetical protein ACTTH5_01220 [Wolinella sp.]
MATSIYLPQNLSDEHLSSLLSEAEKIKENPKVEIPKLMQAITDLALNSGKRALEHKEIAEALEIYLHYLSLEKLHRMGIVKDYERAGAEEFFGESKEIEITLNNPLNG